MKHYLLLVVLLSALFVSACGKEQENTTQEPVQQGTQEESSTEKDETQQLQSSSEPESSKVPESTKAPEPTKPPAGSNAKELLNNEPLNPKKSGYEELDNLTETLINEITNDSMTNYDKVLACYRWFVTGITYTGNMHTTPGRFSDSDAETTPKTVLWATDILNSKKGNCYNFAAGLVYIYRALGYDAHLVSGKTINVKGEFTEHCWCYVNLGGKAYCFDADVDMDRNNRGQGMVYFCRDMAELLKYSYKAETYYDN